MAGIYEKCATCMYEHGNAMTGECRACCFCDKYKPVTGGMSSETKERLIKNELRTFAIKYDLYFDTWNIKDGSFRAKFKNGRGKPITIAIMPDQVDDWIKYTTEIENKLLEELVDAGEPYKGGFVHRGTRNPYMCSANHTILADDILRDLFGSYSKEERMKNKPLTIENVIFNKPATIVFWSDGTKAVVKAQGKARFDKEKGLAMAISKKFLGNKGNYYNEFKKYLGTE